MPTVVENLRVEQGSDFRHDFSVETDQGVARSLAGWTAVGVVKSYAGGDTLHVMALTVQAGKIRLTISGSESATWGWRRARFEIVLCGPQGQRERHVSGVIEVDPQLNDG